MRIHPASCHKSLLKFIFFTATFWHDAAVKATHDNLASVCFKHLLAALFYSLSQLHHNRNEWKHWLWIVDVLPNFGSLDIDFRQIAVRLYVWNVWIKQLKHSLHAIFQKCHIFRTTIPFFFCDTHNFLKSPSNWTHWLRWDHLLWAYIQMRWIFIDRTSHFDWVGWPLNVIFFFIQPKWHISFIA